MPSHATPLLLLLLLLATGCAEVWKRPGTSEAEAEAANQACTGAAAQAVPPNMVWQQTAPERIERERRCWREHGQERCRTVETRHPAQYSQVDINRGARDEWRRGCMQSQGYSFTGYRALRLE